MEYNIEFWKKNSTRRANIFLDIIMSRKYKYLFGQYFKSLQVFIFELQ